MLIVLAPASVYVGYRFTRGAWQRPRVPFLTGSAIREDASAIAGVLYALLGLHILAGRPLPQWLAVTVLVAAVFIERVPTLWRIVQIRRWDAEDHSGTTLRRRWDDPKP